VRVWFFCAKCRERVEASDVHIDTQGCGCLVLSLRCPRCHEYTIINTHDGTVYPCDEPFR